MNTHYEEIGITIKLCEYLNYKNINHLYIKKYEEIQQLLSIYQQGNVMYSKYGLRVNIKNNKKNGIIINYLDNLKSIRAKTVYLIPFTNENNPLVMFKWNKKYRISKKKILRKLKKFSYQSYNQFYESYIMSQQVQQQPILIEQPQVTKKPPALLSVKKLIRSLSNKIEKLNKLL